MTTGNEWVNFAAVKAVVTMQMVLDRYGISNLKRSGDELRGRCPIHKGSDKEKTFTVNIRKNAFKCFAKECEARGNVLDLVAMLENCSVRESALKLQAWFMGGESQSELGTENEDIQNSEQARRGIYRDESGSLYEVVIPEATSDDLAMVVVYRELFGDYGYCVAAPENFTEQEGTGATFTLVKPL